MSTQETFEILTVEQQAEFDATLDRLNLMRAIGNAIDDLERQKNELQQVLSESLGETWTGYVAPPGYTILVTDYGENLRISTHHGKIGYGGESGWYEPSKYRNLEELGRVTYAADFIEVDREGNIFAATHEKPIMVLVGVRARVRLTTKESMEDRQSTAVVIDGQRVDFFNAGSLD